nr:peptidoglycan editing factor PgeF [Caldalkalibacillus salinus]
MAGITTRHGGVSHSPYQSLNCALHVGDRAEDVLNNRKKLLDIHRMPTDAWTCGNQVHGDRLHYVKLSDRGRGRLSQADAIDQVDGLYTDQANVFIASFYADCVPLYFVASSHRMIGVAHAGWKGTVANIGAKLVSEWRQNFNIQPREVFAVIGPSIGQCCYEVDRRVIDQIRTLDKSSDQYAITPLNNDKYLLDLKQVNAESLKKAGIPAENIEVSTWCTGCHTDLFYSHRKEGGQTGRMTAYMALKEEATRT